MNFAFKISQVASKNNSWMGYLIIRTYLNLPGNKDQYNSQWVLFFIYFFLYLNQIHNQTSVGRDYLSRQKSSGDEWTGNPV